VRGRWATDGHQLAAAGDDPAVSAGADEALRERVVVAARRVPGYGEPLGVEGPLGALEQPGVAGQSAERSVRVVEGAPHPGGARAPVVAVLHARVSAGRHRPVQPRDYAPRRARAAVARSDPRARERVDPSALEQADTPADLVVLMVVGQVAGDDRELEPGAPSGAIAHAAERVGVHVAHRPVEGLRTERLVRAPESEERARRAQELEAGRRHLVGKLCVAELGEEGERPAAACPTGANASGRRAPDRERRARGTGTKSPPLGASPIASSSVLRPAGSAAAGTGRPPSIAAAAANRRIAVHRFMPGFSRLAVSAL
jgi:hypothetical protein